MDLNELNEIIKDEKILIFYIKSISCNVCKALLPKLKEVAIQERIKLIDIYIEENRGIVSQYNIFSAPIIIIFVKGKEVYREGRFLRISDFKDEIYKYKKFLL